MGLAGPPASPHPQPQLQTYPEAAGWPGGFSAAGPAVPPAAAGSSPRGLAAGWPRNSPPKSEPLCSPEGRKHREEVVLPHPAWSSLRWRQQPEPVPAGRGSARCPRRDLALRGRSALFSGQVSGLLQRQGMAQPVLLFLRRHSGRAGPAGFGRGICPLGWWLCPRGEGQPRWGRARAWGRRLSLGMGHGRWGEHGAASPARLSGGRGREQVLIFILEAQPVGPSLPGGGGAGGRWGGLLGAWFSLAVYAIFCKEPTSRQRGGGRGQGKQPVQEPPSVSPLRWAG